MAQISFIAPLDQPLGSRRLLDLLREGLTDPRFTCLRIVTAYAKSGPLLRLESSLATWKAAGKRTEAIFGIDQQGTSREALKVAAELCDALYVTRERGITFHPKIYLFDGAASARAIIGSNNLTVGGTETNFECSTVIDLDLPQDQPVYAELTAMWNNLLPATCLATVLVNELMLNELISTGTVLSERQLQLRSRMTSAPPVTPKSGLPLKPASPLPAALMTAGPPTAPVKTANIDIAEPAPPQIAPESVAQQSVSGLAIQIKPHHNGEIFLSKTAVLQNPGFFGWPFTGTTVPKKASNPAYPQRVPDPIVNVDVFGVGPQAKLSLRAYALNTVYYSTKSEIRITASPLVTEVPDYSVMIMVPGTSEGIDYEIIIHRPDSPEYQAWLDACNQSMPSGGQVPRKFGWF